MTVFQGTYLDPQLYTGEPFVATPGGYVVPLDPSASVCQVHGIQYVTPAFQHQVDEGFASVQHSPYLPNTAVEPNVPLLPQESSGSQEDSTKTVFSDLQDTERQQIQEILLQERTKVGKSDSTESSDSGVSESEETPAPDTGRLPLLCQEEPLIEETGQHTAPQANSSEETITNVNAKQSILTGQCVGVQDRIIDELLTSKVEPVGGHEEIQLENHETEVNIVNSEHTNQNYTEDETCNEETPQLTTTPPPTVSNIEKCDSDQEDEADTFKSQTVQGQEDVSETDKEKDVCYDEMIDVAVAVAVPSKCESFDDLLSGSLHQVQEVAQETIVVKCSIPNTENSTDIYTSIENSLITPSLSDIKDCTNSLLQQSDDKDQSSSDMNVYKQNLHVNAEEENCPTGKSEFQEDTIKVIDDGTKDERLNTDETNIEVNEGTLKDLKVTEAVKRWIREVTPEKAFNISEEVQSLLLAENDSIEEMDTEDEYIEDEIAENSKSITVLESKNVKGNPFVAASSDSPNVGMEGCSKRVAFMNKFRGTSPDTFDDCDGASTISNLSHDQLYSEASSSHTASINNSFDDEIDKYLYTEKADMYNPCAYTKYYQLGVEMDETTPTPTPIPHTSLQSWENTPSAHSNSGFVSECGSEDVDTIPHKYKVAHQNNDISPMSLATEILKAEKGMSNILHNDGDQEVAAAHLSIPNADKYVQHYGANSGEVGDSGVQSEESSDETDTRSNVDSSGVGSSLASTPALSPAHCSAKPMFYSHPLRHISTGESPAVPCKTVCCAVM